MPKKSTQQQQQSTRASSRVSKAPNYLVSQGQEQERRNATVFDFTDSPSKKRSPRTKRMLPLSESRNKELLNSPPRNNRSDENVTPKHNSQKSARKEPATVITAPSTSQTKRKKRRIRVIPPSLQPNKKKSKIQSTTSSPQQHNKRTATTPSEISSPLVQSTSSSASKVTNMPAGKQGSIHKQPKMASPPKRTTSLSSPTSRRQSLLSTTKSVLELSFEEQVQLYPPSKSTKVSSRSKDKKSTTMVSSKKAAKGQNKRKKQPEIAATNDDDDVQVPLKKSRKTRSDKGVPRKPRSSIAAPQEEPSTSSKKIQQSKGAVLPPRGPTRKQSTAVPNPKKDDVALPPQEGADNEPLDATDKTKQDESEATARKISEESVHSETDKPPPKKSRKPRKDKGVARKSRIKPDKTEPEPDKNPETSEVPIKKTTRKPRKDKGVPRGPRAKKGTTTDKANDAAASQKPQPRKPRQDKGSKRGTLGYYAGTRCGECLGCRAIQQNCGKCIPCLDMPEFGGPGKLRKLCILRKCLKSSRVAKRQQPKNDKDATGNNASHQHQSASNQSLQSSSEMDHQDDDSKNADNCKDELESLSDRDGSLVEEMSDMEWNDDNRPDPLPAMKRSTRSAHVRKTRSGITLEHSSSKKEAPPVSAAELARRLQEVQRAKINNYEDDDDDDDDDEEEQAQLPPGAFLPPSMPKLGY